MFSFLNLFGLTIFIPLTDAASLLLLFSCCCVQLFATPWWTGGSSSLGFPWQEYWAGVPFPSPGDLSDLGIEPVSPAWQGDSLLIQPPRKPRTEYLIFFSAFGGDRI